MKRAILASILLLASCDFRSTEDLAKLVPTATPESAVKIERRAQAILSELESKGKENSLEAADAGDVILEVRMATGGMARPDTVQLAEQVVGIRRAHPDSRLNRSLYMCAVAHRYGKDLKAAQDRMFEATQIIERFKDSIDANRAAQTYGGYATVLLERGDYKDARKQYEAAFTLLEAAKSPDPKVRGKMDHNYGDLLTDLGEYDEAAERLRAALAIREALDEKGEEAAQTHNALGGRAEEVGDLAEAKSEYQSALAIYEALGEEDFAGEIASVKSNSGMVAFAQGDLEVADKDYRDAELFFRSQGDRDDDLAHVLSNRGELTLTRDKSPARWQEARTLFSEAFEKRCVFYSDAEADKADAVAATCKQLASDPSASDLQAVPTHRDLAESLAQLGRVDIAEGRATLGRARLTRALEIWTEAFGPQHPLCGRTKRDMASALWAEGDPGGAFLLAREADDIIRDHVRQTVSRLPENSALRYASALPKPKDLVVSIAEDDASKWRDAFDTVIRSRAIVLDEEAGRWEAAALSDDASVQEARRAFEAASRRCGYLALRAPEALSVEEYTRAREEACADADAKEEALARTTDRSPLLQQRRQERQFGIDRIAKEARDLPAGSALVSYVIYQTGLDDPRLGAFVLHPSTGRVRFIQLGSLAAVDALVDDWRRHFNKDAHDPDAYRATATKLREAVWDKVERELNGTSTIFIVPDGKLSLVSFATLPSGDGYLVETKSFHYLSAERDLVARTRAAQKGVLVVSGPAFDRAPGGEARCLEPDPAPHSPVQDSEKRAKALIDIADARTRGNQSLVGAGASKPAFENLAPSFRDVYVLTHAEVDEPGAADDDANHRQDDPLLRSRLLFAGADCRKWSDATLTDTGVLTAKELAGLDLSNVSSLILHACKTGTGPDVRVDEGVVGLRRAVHTAGAGAIVMTLWEVDDLRTQPWMTDFFERRYKKPRGESLVEAVNAATRDRYEALGPSAHPYWWGGFVSAGDWR